MPTKHGIINSIGGGLSIGKKSLNISHQHNDSSLFEMNQSLVRPGGCYTKGNNTGIFNLTNILKQNMLEDDGLEDMHFYFVAF